MEGWSAEGRGQGVTQQTAASFRAASGDGGCMMRQHFQLDRGPCQPAGDAASFRADLGGSVWEGEKDGTTQCQAVTCGSSRSGMGRGAKPDEDGLNPNEVTLCRTERGTGRH
ncbi:hypothetical protein VTN00DRAFT_9573 [Thermoascus crustaceus]|uniref:uncharacterized protein n=1 Tax=Thermoascus crustaceus TaxID=5088 RepID=UPI003742FC67